MQRFAGAAVIFAAALLPAAAFAVNPRIPHGGSAAFGITGRDVPASGSWDIARSGAIVASSGKARGWQVQYDTRLGRFTVLAPLSAPLAAGYEVRYASRASAVFDVVPGLSAFTLPSAAVSAGATVLGKVTLTDAAPSAGIYVTLTGSDQTTAQVPPSAFILAGATSATFSVTTYGTASPTPVTLRAGFLGTTLTANLTVNPNSHLAVFSAANAAISQSGYFTSAIAGASARAGSDFASRDCRMDFVAHGQACTLFCCTGDGGSVLVSVDGSPFLEATPQTPNDWNALNLFSGLADADHLVTLQQRNGSPSFLVDNQRMLCVQGSAPTLRSMADANPSLWGRQQYPVTDANGVASPYIVSEAGTLSLQPNIDGYPALLYADLYAEGSTIMQATGSGVCAFLLLNGSCWQALVDGVPQPVVTTPQTGGYGWVVLAAGLNSATPHQIVVTDVSNREKTASSALYAFMFPGGALTAQKPPVRPIFAVTGHSIVAGHLLQNMTQVYYHAMAQAHGYAIASRGIPGSTFKAFDSSDTLVSTQSGQARIYEIVDLQPALCLIDDFVNDAIIYPRETPADLQAALQDYLPYVLQKCPKTKFYVLGILDRYGPPDPTPWNAAIQAAVTAQNSSRCIYISQTGWIIPGTPGHFIDTIDGTHPNTQGSQKIAAKLGPILFPLSTQAPPGRQFGRSPISSSE